MAKPTYEELLAQLAKATAEKESLARLVAQQTGAGGLAQGESAVAAGAGGVAIGGDFQGTLYVGRPPRNDTEALTIYRRMLVTGCKHLPLRGVDVGAADPTGGQKQIDLDQVYVSLDTTTRMQVPATSEDRKSDSPRDEDLPLTALEATASNRHLVILGDPGSGDETPEFECTLIREGFRISRYPLTVAQYQPFIEAKGYEQGQYWTSAGWTWREKYAVTGPEDYDDVFQTPNHPRVGVGWYEAVAYCKWLSEVLGFELNLPTEAQWERAARHTDWSLLSMGQRGG